MKPKDVLFALRALRRSPGFTATAILTLALGIGAGTAMFTVVDAVLLKALPYPDSSRIVAINTRWKDSGKVSQRTTGGDLMALREDAKSFEAFTYYHGGQFGVRVAPAGLPQIRAEKSSPSNRTCKPPGSGARVMGRPGAAPR